MKIQRKATIAYIESVRPITRDDLQSLREPASRQTLKHLRDSHHMIARLTAQGLSMSEVSNRVGMGYSRISLLLRDPSMVELINRYRDKVTEVWKDQVDDYMSLATANMLKAERQIADKLDEADAAGELLPVRELIAISRDAADRFGYGKKTTNLNVNVDFAAKLEAARKRSNRVIEGEYAVDESV